MHADACDCPANLAGALPAGALPAVLAAMAAHPGDAGVREKETPACWLLEKLASVAGGCDAIAAAGGIEALVNSLQRRPDVKEVQQHCIAALELLARRSPERQRLMMLLLAPSSLAVSLTPAALVFETEVLPTAAPESAQRARDALDGALLMRYSPGAFVKDFALPLQDMFLDVANVVDLISECRLVWSSLLLGSLAYNGMATGAMEAAAGKPGRGVANIVSCGLLGLLHESRESHATGRRSETLALYKAVEAVESTISYLATGNAVCVAGNMHGYAAMTMKQACLRWGSTISSLVLLPLTAQDVDKACMLRSLQQRHLRRGMRGTLSAFPLLAYHASGVAANLVCEPLVYAVGAAGGAASGSVACAAQWAVFLVTSRGIQGTWVVVDEGGSMKDGEFVVTRRAVQFPDGSSFAVDQLDGQPVRVDLPREAVTLSLSGSRDNVTCSRGSVEMSTGAIISWKDGRMMHKKDTQRWRGKCLPARCQP